MSGTQYPLQSMLRVRGLHEEQARRTAKQTEERLHEAQMQLHKRITELARYQKWRPQEEDHLYAAMFNKPANVDKLGAFREELLRLAQGEVERQQQVTEAEKIVREREKEKDLAQQEVILARRACMKLEKHRDIWIATIRKEKEHLADLEMEEVRGATRGSDEN